MYGFYVSQFEFKIISNKKTSSDFKIFYDYKLALNIYTNLSSGSGNSLSIAEEAKHAKLNFILLSDTNTNYDLDIDRYLDNIGILNGIRIKNKDRAFIYYSSVKKNFYNTSLNNIENDPSAVVIETHPLGQPYNLDILKEKNLDGFEVLNFKNITQKSWKESKISTIWSLIYYPFNPRLALLRLFHEPIEELKIFDEISQTKKINFYVGSEATAKAIPFTGWLIKFPSYESSFVIGSQHLTLMSELTGNIENDSQHIVQALKNGKSYVAFDALGDPNGFETYLIDGKKQYLTGDSVKFKNNLKVYYKLPAEPIPFYEVVLYRNGRRIDHLNTFTGQFNITQSGVYRIQVRVSPNFPLPDAIKWITWIYTNNFYVE